MPSSSSTEMYTLSGTITVPKSTAIDSDVNEINVVPVSNDTFATAQILKKNPVILGGYVNVPSQGEDGNSYEDGDLIDIFKITLTKNETVYLYIAEYEVTDLDLYLYDGSQNVVVSSTGGNDIETVKAPSAGTYFIKVQAVAGASNYTLIMGQSITEATIMHERLEEDFIPGDIVIKLKYETQELSESNHRSVSDPFMGLVYKSGTIDSELVLKIDPDNRQQVFSALNIAPTENNRQLFQADDPVAQLKLDTLRTIDALKEQPDVAFAEPNYLRYPMEVPNDAYYPRQWHYPLINLPQAWEIIEMSPGGGEVIVAVIDTGILSNHPDIDSNRVEDGYDFFSYDENPEDPGDGMEGGSTFHGTHVAGTIAATTNNLIGVAGVAPNCRIMPLRALGNGSGTAFDIRQAIYYAAGLNNSSGTLPTKRADIINMSLGGVSWSDLDQIAINAARNAGVIIIASAGNDASNVPVYPAAYNGVISVSSVGADKQLAYYSSFGNTIDIAAPGGNMSQDFDGDGHLDGVWSTSGDDTSDPIKMAYHPLQGTSMAAPHVAGVIALMKSIAPNLTPDMLDAFIADETNTPLTDDLAPVGRDDNYGYGLINAFKAVQTVSGGLPTYLYVSPLSLNFGSATTEMSLVAQNFNLDDPLISVTVTENEPWLEIVGSFDDMEQKGTFTVIVDRAQVPDDGPYATSILLDSDINSVEVSVRMQKGVPSSGDAGYHYILLLDPDTYVPYKQFDVPAPVDGVYPFSILAPPGEYILFAGTDYDNDYTIGDHGESVGAFKTIDQPKDINLYRDRSGFNFTTSFNFSLPTSLAGDADGYEFHVQREGGFRVEKP